MWIFDDLFSQGKPIILKMLDNLLSFLKHQNCSSLQISVSPDYRAQRNTSQINNLRYIYMVKNYGSVLQNRFLLPNSKAYFNDVIWRYYNTCNENLNPRLEYFRKNKNKFPALCKYCRRPGPPYKRRKPRSFFSWICSLIGCDKKPKDKLKCCRNVCKGDELKEVLTNEASKGVEKLSYQEKRRSNLKKTSKLTPSSSDCTDPKSTESTDNDKNLQKINEDEKLDLRDKKLSELCVKYNLEEVWLSDKASEDIEKTSTVPCIQQKVLPSINVISGNGQGIEKKESGKYITESKDPNEKTSQDQKNKVPRCLEPCSKRSETGKFEINLCKTCDDKKIEAIKKEREPLNLAAIKDTKSSSLLVPGSTNISELKETLSKPEMTPDTNKTNISEQKPPEKIPEPPLTPIQVANDVTRESTKEQIPKPCLIQTQDESDIKKESTREKDTDKTSDNINQPCVLTKTDQSDVTSESVRTEHPETSSGEISEPHESLTDQDSESNEEKTIATIPSEILKLEDDETKECVTLLTYNLNVTECVAKATEQLCKDNEDTSTDKEYQLSLVLSECNIKKCGSNNEISNEDSDSLNTKKLNESKSEKKLDENLEPVDKKVSETESKSYIFPALGLENEKMSKDKLAEANFELIEDKNVTKTESCQTSEPVVGGKLKTTNDGAEIDTKEPENLQHLKQMNTQTSQPLETKDYNESILNETSKTFKDEGFNDTIVKVNNSKSTQQLDEKCMKILKALEEATFDKLKSNESDIKGGRLSEDLDKGSKEIKSPINEAVKVESTKQSNQISQKISSLQEKNDSEKKFDEGSMIKQEALQRSGNASRPEVEQLFFKAPASLRRKVSGEIIEGVSLQKQLHDQNLNKNKSTEKLTYESTGFNKVNSDVNLPTLKAPLSQKMTILDGKTPGPNRLGEASKNENDCLKVLVDGNLEEGYNTDCPKVIHPILNASSQQLDKTTIKKENNKLKSDENIPSVSTKHNSVPNFQLWDDEAKKMEKIDNIKSNTTISNSPYQERKFSFTMPKSSSSESRTNLFGASYNTATLFKDMAYLLPERNKRVAKHQRFKRAESKQEDLIALNTFANKVAKHGKTMKEHEVDRIYFASSKLTMNKEKLPKASQQNKQPKVENRINFVNRSYLKGNKRSRIELPIDENYAHPGEKKEISEMITNLDEMNDLKLLTYKTHEFCKIMLELVKLFSAYKTSTDALFNNKSIEHLKLKQKKLQELQNTIKHLEENVQEFLQLSNGELASKKSSRPKSKPKINFYSYSDSERENTNPFDWSKPETNHSNSNFQNSKLTITNYQSPASTSTSRENQNILPNIITSSDEDEFRKTLLDLVLLFTTPDEIFNRKNQVIGNKGLKRKRGLSS